MTHTIVYAEKQTINYFNKSYYNYETLSPYEEYLKNSKIQKVILSYNNHYGPDIFVHYNMFISDKDSNIATFIYTDNGDYLHIDVITRILIDPVRKRLFLHDAIIDYRYYAISSFEEDVRFIGRLKSLMKFYRNKNETFFKNMTNMFFGSDWIFHSGSKKFIKRKQEEYEYKLNMYNLPNDINYEIRNRLDIYKLKNVCLLKFEDIENMKKYIDNYVGVSTSANFRSYLWDKILAINNPQ
jgi:hypothetical protein